MFGRKKRVRIDPALYAAALRVAAERGYESVDAMVTHLLSAELRGGRDEKNDDDRKALEKLKGLGYF